MNRCTFGAMFALFLYSAFPDTLELRPPPPEEDEDEDDPEKPHWPHDPYGEPCEPENPSGPDPEHPPPEDDPTEEDPKPEEQEEPDLRPAAEGPWFTPTGPMRAEGLARLHERLLGGDLAQGVSGESVTWSSRVENTPLRVNPAYAILRNVSHLLGW